ncbi:MAG: hypothetical protein ACP5GX_00715 [Anaerolineae bacterium]
MRTERVITRDLDGELIEVSDGEGVHYVKRLSLEVAWHTNAPEDLAYWLEPLVTEVDEAWSQRKLLIHYNPFLKPLSRSQLQTILRPESPLAGWRLAHLAADLCRWLERFHTADYPQAVIHPRRVGLLDGRFVLLPTLAGIMSPLSKSLSGSIRSWLPFIAPEILRTRAKSPALLPAGDVYALGRMLQALAAPERTEVLPDDPYEAAEQIVETSAASIPFEWPEGFDEIAEVVETMVDLSPEARPTAAELATTFHALVGQLDPERVIQALIEERDLGEAQAHLEALNASQGEGAFAFPHSKLHLLQADVALAQSPPDFTRAIDELEKAKGFEPKNPAIHQRIGRTYRDYTEHSQHLLLADYAYQKAALLSGWRGDIVEEWVEILQQSTSERLLERTRAIPWEKRPAVVFARRAAALLEKGNYHGSWHECVDYFSQFGFSQSVYGTARLAASHIPPVELLIWMRERQNIEKLPAVQAIVWERNGQPEKAALYYAHALRAASEED